MAVAGKVFWGDLIYDLDFATKKKKQTNPAKHNLEIYGKMSSFKISKSILY